MLPDIWHYHPDTHILLGAGQADQSPLDPPGTWLVPACATDIEPPATPKGKVAVFVDGDWTLQDPPPPTPPETGIVE